MSKRKRELVNLKGVDELSQDIADAVGGPVTVCVAYKTTRDKKGRVVHRCSEYLPSNRVIDMEYDDPKKIDWQLRERSGLKKPDTYSYSSPKVGGRSVRVHPIGWKPEKRAGRTKISKRKRK